MLFWSLFLPLGIRWSVDRRLQTSRPVDQGPLTSISSAVLLLQLAVMYLSAAAFKWHPVWNREFSAVYYVLHGDTFVTPLGLWLRQYPTVMQWLTARYARLGNRGTIIGILTLGQSLVPRTCDRGLHAVSPRIGLDGHVRFVPLDLYQRLVAVCPDVVLGLARAEVGGPSSRWSAAEPWFRRATQWLPENLQAVAASQSEPIRLHSPWWRQVGVGLLFVYIVTWNIREILGPAWVDRVMPHRFNGLACALGLTQNWSMFAPIPRIEDGWIVMKGTLRDGSEVNLWEPGHPLPWDKPRLVSAMFPSSRWRRYLENLPLDRSRFPPPVPRQLAAAAMGSRVFRWPKKKRRWPKWS